MAKKKEIKKDEEDIILGASLEGDELSCPTCGSPLANTIKDYQEVIYSGDGEQYTQIVRRCSLKGCRTISHYEMDLSIEYRLLYVFNYKECKKIKDEQIKVKEEE